jgi:hypothetical protein
MNAVIGRPAQYPLLGMKIGDSVTFDVPTGADVKRVARNVSNYNNRYEMFFRCKTDRKTRVMTVTRLR